MKRMAASRNITIRATSADGSFTDQVMAIDINDVDEFDVGTVNDADASINAIDENATVGTVVGVTAAAADADATTNAITYSLQDNDGGRFAIDSSSGVVTVAGAIDREADGGSRNITVRATSADGSFTDQVMTININDLDEFDVGSVSDVDGTANQVNENATVGTVVGVTASASDADATTNAITYSLQDNDGGRFAIDSGSGVVTVAGAIDREADGASRNITVRATSADGSFTDQVMTININDVDEFDVGTVTDANATANVVDENATVGTIVGVTGLASDADATTNAITYTLQDNDGGRFAIDSGSGIVTVAGVIDREADGASRNITVRATSADGSFTDQLMTINISDVDEFDVGSVTDADAAVNAVDENATIGTLVGVTGLGSDADATTNAISYSLQDNDGGRFAIDSGSGIVTVAGAIDREADGASRNITVRATSADGSFTDQIMAVSINDVDEFDVGTVTDADATANAVDENATVGTAVGITASGSDADATNDAITYSLSNDDGGRFTIDSNSGVVTVAGAIDRETDGGSRNITVRATSADGSFTDQLFAIGVNPINDNDPIIVSDGGGAAAALTIVENSTLVTTVIATDADLPAQTVSYSIVGGADSTKFSINSSTGELNFVSAPNFESPTDSGGDNVYDVTVQASDGAGRTDTQSISVAVEDLRVTTDSQTTGSTTASSLTLAHTSSGDDRLMLVTVSMANPASRSVSGVTYNGDSLIFVGSRSNGSNEARIEIWALVAPDLGSHNVNVTLTSSNSAGTVVGVTTFTGVDQSTPLGSFVSAAGDSSNPGVNVSSGADELVFAGITVESGSNYNLSPGGGQTELWDLYRSNANSGASTEEGAASVNMSWTFGDDNQWAVGAVSIRAAVATNFAPIIVSSGGGNTAAVAIAENATAVATVIATDSDLPAQTMIYSIVGGDDAAQFSIDSGTGVLTFLSAPNFEVPLDTDADNMYEVTVQASDGSGGSDVQSIGVTISDTDEFDVGPVSDIDGAINAVDENSIVGTVVGLTASASDADGTNNTITYTLQDNDGGRFAIDSSSGVVTVAGAIDREADGASRNITIRATSADGSFTDQVMAIAINDVDEFDVGSVSDVDGTANQVNENATVGTVVGVTARPPMLTPQPTRSLTRCKTTTADGSRSIPVSGVVTVAGSD